MFTCQCFCNKKGVSSLALPLPASGLPAGGPGGLRSGGTKAGPAKAVRSRTAVAQVCQ